MSEEEILEILKEFNKIKINSYAMQFVNISYPKLQMAIQGLLDLYKKQINENNMYKDLTRQAQEDVKIWKDLYNKEKEKNKWKLISEYNREKYDWVLVKYFDGDYECVPEVAEKRSDGKWYTSEKEIPFEVKYFFDMQELLEESK